MPDGNLKPNKVRPAGAGASETAVQGDIDALLKEADTLEIEVEAQMAKEGGGLRNLRVRIFVDIDNDTTEAELNQTKKAIADVITAFMDNLRVK